MVRRGYKTPSKLLGQIYWLIWCKRGSAPGAETPAIPDVVDAVDTGDVVEGVGVDGVGFVECVGLSGDLAGRSSGLISNRGYSAVHRSLFVSTLHRSDPISCQNSHVALWVYSVNKLLKYMD